MGSIETIWGHIISVERMVEGFRINYLEFSDAIDAGEMLIDISRVL